MKSSFKPLVCSIQLSEMTIPYMLKRSKRAKYLRMQIRNNGDLEVILPRGFQITDVEKFLHEKYDWIKKHLNNRKQAENKFYLLGKEIEVTQNYDLFVKRHKISLKNDHLIITSMAGSVEDTEMLYECWLRKQAKKYLVLRVQKIADDLNFKMGKITIRGQKTRWGSCSTNGNLSFNYNLLRFRKEIIDYVIIHELCHLKEMNHSVKFWKLVERFCPDYRLMRKELKNHSI